MGKAFSLPLVYEKEVTYEKELLALVYVVKKMETILVGKNLLY